MGFIDTLRRFAPTKQVVNAFPHHRAHLPFVRIQLAPDRFHRAEPRDDSVLFGQRDLFAGDGFGFWASLPSVVSLDLGRSMKAPPRARDSCLGF